MRSGIEERAASDLSTSLEGEVTVRVHDRVVLWSLARGRLDDVEITAPQVTFRQDERSAQVSQLAVRARAVRGVMGNGPLHLGELDASGRMTYAEFGRLIGCAVKPAGQGRITLTREVSTAGMAGTLQVTAKASADAAGRLQLEEPQATLDGRPLPQAMVAMAMAGLSQRASVPGMPNLKYESITADDQGLAVQLTGRDVTLQR